MSPHLTSRRLTSPHMTLWPRLASLRFLIIHTQYNVCVYALHKYMVYSLYIYCTIRPRVLVMGRLCRATRAEPCLPACLPTRAVLALVTVFYSYFYFDFGSCSCSCSCSCSKLLTTRVYIHTIVHTHICPCMDWYTCHDVQVHTFVCTMRCRAAQ